MIRALERLAAPLAGASTLTLAGGGAWFALDGWASLDPAWMPAMVACLVAGIAASALALVWAARGAWHLAAPAALAAMAVPTGFAYAGNALTLALGVVAGALAVATRARRRQPARSTAR
ncbi:hypothetical protein QQX09_08870 [Demequina sp. SYSU T00192]|uniref:SPW repeat-containing protein n=1 Tax=Demequina litoralis TaxID=3051660 RepID=A0ABT8G9Z7_9MICO|nr:hypothetical protein [Demequina sp. SYSU T00192]MDN4475965.1 hypothetical protein [Demequina sp. SYSU T00192]